MVSKKSFPQNGRVRGGAVPYKKPFKPLQGGDSVGAGNFNSMMFNTSQIPDNPGYMDFNNPTPPLVSGGSSGSGMSGINVGQQKKKNNKNKQKNRQPQPTHHTIDTNTVWPKNKMPPQKFKRGFSMGDCGLRGGFVGPFGNGGGGNGLNRGRHMMMPPIGGALGGPRALGGPMPPMPPPHGFQPPMIPPMGRNGPMPPMVGVQHHPLFMRRNGRNGPMPPIPPSMPPMMHAHGGPQPAPFCGNNVGKIKKSKLVNKKVIKGKSTIKTLRNLVNQYPIDKPWVTVEIRNEHDKKLDIENRLKGNKDDELFAQFKTQRDKFVTMYETAREEYLKKEAAAVKAKDANKDKQTNNKTSAKDGINNEAIPNSKK